MAALYMVPDPDNPDHKTAAELVRIKDAKEPFCYVELEDGTTLTMRTSIMEVLRVLERWDKNGNPVYNITTQSSVSTSYPEHLRKA